MENQEGESSQINPNREEEDGSSSSSDAEENADTFRQRPQRAGISFLNRVRNFVSQRTFDEDDLDNEENNYPSLAQNDELLDNVSFTTEENSSDENDSDALFEQYISQASQMTGDERTDFDVELPVQHKYLGETERVKGLACLEVGETYEIPVLAHHSWIFPGEIVPMILLEQRFCSRIADENEGLIFGLIFQNDGLEDKTRYGVTCQVYEKGVDYRGHTTLKSKAYQRFVVLKTEDGQIATMRNQMFFAKVKVLPEIVLPEPIHLTLTSSLLRHNQFKRTSKKIKSFAAASTPWPSFVYELYSSVRATEKMERCLGMITIEPPVDAVKRSFWYARNLPLNEGDIQLIFKSNNVNQRLLIIDERLETNCYFLCKRCCNPIAMFKNIFAMTKDTVHAIYCNPAGYMHETVTLTRTLESAVNMVDRPSTEFSWFPGYAWQIAVCSRCETHVGWRFIAVRDKLLRPRSFFGLSSKSLLMGPPESPPDADATHPSATEAVVD